jgi:VanZ family protein
VVLYMVFIFTLSSIPQPPGVPGDSDKLAHAVLYLGLGLVAVRAFAGGWSRPVTARVACAAVALSALYAVSDELHQLVVPNRHADVFDVVADVIGAAIAPGAVIAWGIIRARNGL